MSVFLLVFLSLSLSGYCRFSGIKGGNVSGRREREEGCMGAMICGFRISKNRMNEKNLITIVDDSCQHSEAQRVNHKDLSLGLGRLRSGADEIWAICGVWSYVG